MKKKLIGTCPRCEASAAIGLSRILELPTGIPHKCDSCGVQMQVSPKHPILSGVAKMISYFTIYSIYMLNDPSPANLGCGILGFFILFSIIHKTIGRPILTIYKPERNFLEEELGTSGITNPK